MCVARRHRRVPRQHPERSGFACSVNSQQTEALPLVYAETYVVDRRVLLAVRATVRLQRTSVI